MTSVPLGNGRNISRGYCFSYIVFDYLDFTETSALAAPITGSSQRRDYRSSSAGSRSVGYCIPQYDPTINHLSYWFTGDGWDGACSFYPTVLAQSEARPELITELVSISPAPPAPYTTDLMVFTSPSSSMLIVEPACLVMTTGFASRQSLPWKLLFQWSFLPICWWLIWLLLRCPSRPRLRRLILPLLSLQCSRLILKGSSFRSWWTTSIKALGDASLWY